MNKFLAILLSVALVGCSAPGQRSEMTASEAGAATVVKKGEFDSHTQIDSPMITSNGTRNGVTDLFHTNGVALRGVKDAKLGIVIHQVYIDILYMDNEWRFYRSASLPGGKTSDLTVIKRKVTACGRHRSCTYNEVVGFNVSEADLKAGGDLRFRLNSRSGLEDVVIIPKGLIEGYLSKVHG